MSLSDPTDIELDEIDRIHIKLVDQYLTLENKLRHDEITAEKMFEMGRQYHIEAHTSIEALIEQQRIGWTIELPDLPHFQIRALSIDEPAEWLSPIYDTKDLPAVVAALSTKGPQNG